MTFGPVMLDIAGTALSAADRELLQHPNVGGVVLFARNYADTEQLAALVADIHALREPHLLVAVDQEGGRVQRFRDGFTELPAMARLGARFDVNPGAAAREARALGWLLAAELLAVGVDFSFAPVLDLRRDISRVIGERAFHPDPEVVAELGTAVMRGMAQAGMAAVGKHFPGHGSVAPDSHHERPRDPRPRADILQLDGLPFARLAHLGLPGIMPAHITYPDVDTVPACFSRVWLEQILRMEMGFSGAVFSDDLAMAGAGAEGTPLNRAAAALEAGCDMILLCNDRPAAEAVVEGLEQTDRPVAAARLMRMHGRPGDGVDRGLQHTTPWRIARDVVTAIGADEGVASNDG